MKYSIRKLLLITLFFGVIFAILAHYHNRSHHLSRISDTGVVVNWDGNNFVLLVGPSWKYAPISTIVPNEQRGTRRLTAPGLRVVADSLCKLGKPVEISFWEQEISLRHARILADVPQLFQLRLNNCSIPTEALDKLGSSSLKSLCIRACDGLDDKAIDEFRQKFPEITVSID